MSNYGTVLNITTKTGGVEKPVKLTIFVEADSAEEAVARLRSAAARIISKPGTITNMTEYSLVYEEYGNSNSIPTVYTLFNTPTYTNINTTGYTFTTNNTIPVTVTFATNSGYTISQPENNV
jgi:hypothetical protein